MKQRALNLILLLISTCSLLLTLSGCAVSSEHNDPEETFIESYEYEPTDDILDNPFIGLGCYADVELDTIRQDVSLVYVEARWSELEPEEGKYDFSKLEEDKRFDYWRSRNVRAVFRLLLDYPGDEEHMDIPEWLYEATADGEFYDISYGKGYCPDYSNERLLEAHKRLISEIARRYDNDDFIAYIQMGSVGHWGEWHISSDINISLSAETYNKYIDQYIDVFKNTPLMMRRPFARITDSYVGLYNDSAGLKEPTEKWLGWIDSGGDYEGRAGELTAMPDQWRRAPVGGEISSLIEDKSVLLGDDFEDQLDMFRRAHTSWIGPGSFALCDVSDGKEYENLRTLLNTIGYRYYVSNLDISKERSGYKINIRLKNSGTAPIYFGWKTRVRFVYEDGAYEIVDNLIDIRNVMPDADGEISIESEKLPEEIWLGIFDPSDSDEGLELAMNTGCYKAWYRLK